MKEIALAGTYRVLTDTVKTLGTDWCGHARCVLDALDPEPEGCYFDLHPSSDWYDPESYYGSIQHADDDPYGHHLMYDVL